jgi:hypothetical protein
MKKLFLTAFIFYTLSLAAQNPADMNALMPDSLMRGSNKSTILKDSFIFCSVTYKIPRDCNKKNQANCCSGDINPPQLGCYNGTTLTWDYFKSKDIARQNFESIPAQWIQQSKKLSSEKITCFLVNQIVSATKIKYETKEGHLSYSILAYGIVNGQAVLVNLISSKEIKNNKDIQPVFQQIIKFSE